MLTSAALHLFRALNVRKTHHGTEDTPVAELAELTRIQKEAVQPFSRSNIMIKRWKPDVDLASMVPFDANAGMKNATMNPCGEFVKGVHSFRSIIALSALASSNPASSICMVWGHLPAYRSLVAALPSLCPQFLPRRPFRHPCTFW